MGGNRLAPLLLVTVVVLAASTCSNNVTADALVGRYEGNHRDGLEVLVLNRDRTYDYRYSGPKSKTTVNSGHWSFEYRDGEPRVSFSGFVFGPNGYGTKTPGIWDVQVEHSLSGRVRLYVDSDVDYFYERR
jgi:hypothetical protein